MDTKMISRFFALLLSSCLGAAEYHVAVNGTGDYTAGSPGGDVAYAVGTLATANGDVVHLAPGTYELSSGQYSHLTLAQGVTLLGGSDDPSETVLQGNGTMRVIYANPKAVIRNLTVRGGNTPYQGGGITGDKNTATAQNLAVSNCIVENCTAKCMGGGGSAGVWRNCIVRNCQTLNAGDIISNASGSGAGLFGGDFYDCIITNNVAKAAGGGVGACAINGVAIPVGWYVNAYNCEIAYNTSSQGGGVASYDSAHCRLVDCRVHDNKSTTHGGGVYNVTAIGGEIASNLAYQYGGGICGGTVTNGVVHSNHTYGNSKTGGGGGYGATMISCIITNNVSDGYGGGCFSCTNRGALMAGNTATIGGGAIGGRYERCEFRANTALNNQGGAAYNAETYNCLVISNLTYNNGTFCRGYHQGDLLVDNRFSVAGYANSGKDFDGTTTDGNTCIAVNCTVVRHADTPDATSAGRPAIANTAITNVLVYGFACDVGYLKAASHSFWKTGTAPAGAVNCLVGDDPKFVTAAGETDPDAKGRKIGPWSLRQSSPCVGAGINLAWMANARDILGNERLFRYNPTVDIGACECWWEVGTLFLVR